MKRDKSIAPSFSPDFFLFKEMGSFINISAFVCSSPAATGMFSSSKVHRLTCCTTYHKRPSVRTHHPVMLSLQLDSQAEASVRSAIQDTGVDKTVNYNNEAPGEFKGMTLHFISKTILVDGRPSNVLRQHIEDVLQEEGDPIRWAIVDADIEQQTCRVDAVVSRM